MRTIDWDLLASYVGLLTLATGSIYVGSFGSLPAEQHHDVRERKSSTDSEDSEEEEALERLSARDAWLFPIFGSVALVGLYVVIKYVGHEWLNWFLGWYFAFMGIGSVWKTLTALAYYYLGPKRWKEFEKTRVLIKHGSTDLFDFSWRTPTSVLFPLAALPSILYSQNSLSRKSALLTDILSLSFCYNALSLLKLDSFQTGTILLSGLFFYDVWWVFGTDIMVKVATTVDAPIKLLWPKSFKFSSENGFTLLGLGDVIIPGTLIALALRYDHHRASTLRNGSFNKPYFWAALVAYVFGLSTSFVVLHIFEYGQPALLYLSPACILSFVITAVIRGELPQVWSWSDEPDVKEKGTAGEKEKAM